MLFHRKGTAGFRLIFANVSTNIVANCPMWTVRRETEAVPRVAQTGRVDPRLEQAVRNNAEWCDLVCRAHGIVTRFDPDAWLALGRTPMFYPDAVTLMPAPGDLLARIDATPGYSVKDSFAALDLSGYGFEVLFEAEWVHRPPAAVEDSPEWTVVRTPERLRQWGMAHGGGDVFRPELLDETAVAILARTDDAGTIVAGVIGNRSGSVVGLSNSFGLDAGWTTAVRAVGARFPGLAMVGYESGPELAAAKAAGFVGIGPLRVWTRSEGQDRPTSA